MLFGKVYLFTLMCTVRRHVLTCALIGQKMHLTGCYYGNDMRNAKSWNETFCFKRLHCYNEDDEFNSYSREVCSTESVISQIQQE